MRKTTLRHKKRKGFTLVELIVVIAILAILAVGAVVAYGNIMETAEQNAARANANVIVRSVNTYNSLVSSSADRIDYTTFNALTTVAGLNALFVTANMIVDVDLTVEATDAEFVAAKDHIEAGTVGLRLKTS